MIEIGYWKIRGLVGSIRLLLEYVGEEWKETNYVATLKDGCDGSDLINHWDRSDWMKVKNSEDFQWKFAFPNLPYMIDGDVCLSQSATILKV